MFEFAKCRIPMICRIGSINVFLKASLVVNFKNIQNERMWKINIRVSQLQQLSTMTNVSSLSSPAPSYFKQTPDFVSLCKIWTLNFLKHNYSTITHLKIFKQVLNNKFSCWERSLHCHCLKSPSCLFI